MTVDVIAPLLCSGTPVASLSPNGRRADKPGRRPNPLVKGGDAMADTIRGKLAEAGNAVSETAKKVGNRISEKAEEARDRAKEKLHKAQNRAEEAAEKAENEAEKAREDAKAKAENCGCN
jgi:gas vesicle protein